MGLFAATALSGALWLLGTGLHPVAVLTWFAPLPVLILALRAGPRATAAAAAGSWLIGQAGIVPYYLRTLEVPAALVAGMSVVGAALLAATVATARTLILRGRTTTAVAAAPAVWVVGEYVVSRLLPHGAWWSLGYTQADHRVVIGVAAVTGVWGVTYLLLVVPVAVAAGLRSGARRRAGAALLVPLVLSGSWSVWNLAGPEAGPAADSGTGSAADSGTGSAADSGTGSAAGSGTGSAGRTGPAGTSDLLLAGLVALPQDGDPVAPDTPAGAALLARYATSVTALAGAGAGTIVLPEKVFRVTGSTMPVVAQALAHRDTEVVVGVESHDDGAVTNEALVIGPGATVVARYRKRHLIPGLEDGLTPGHEAVVLHGRLGLAVCKDLDFPDLVRGYARGGATTLLAPAWDFGADGWLHSRMAVVRGVESGVTVVRPARDGRVTVSDRTGRILADTAAGPAGTALTVSAAHTAGPTVYARLGDWFPVLCELGLALSVTQVGLRRRLQPTAQNHLARAVGVELDPGQLPAGELRLDGELRRRGQPVDVRGQPQRGVFIIHTI